MKKINITFGILIGASMLLSACAQPAAAPAEAPAEEPAPAETEIVYEEQPYAENLPTAPTIDTPLVVAYETFSQKFSPFFGDTAYDIDVANLTQITLLTTDRVGGIIYNAIEGETVSLGFKYQVQP